MRSSLLTLSREPQTLRFPRISTLSARSTFSRDVSYSLRSEIALANKPFRAMEGLRNLVEKYPKGYQGSEAMKTESAAEPEKRLL